MKIKSLSLLSMILFLFLMGSSIKAQNNVSEADSSNYKTFNFYFINGYAISFDMIKNSKSVIRVHLDFSGTLTDINGDGTQINTGQMDQSTTNGQKNGSWSAALSFYYLHTFYNSNLGEVYAGIGPGFGYTKENYSSSQGYNSASSYNNYTSETETKNYSVGLTFVLGIKSYITKSLSVFAESQFSGGKRWQKQDYSYSSTSNYGVSYQSSNTSGHGWFGDAQFIRLGISISL